MSRELARRLASALNVRSGSAVNAIDDVLRAYVRLTPQAGSIEVSGSIAWTNVTGKPVVFPADPALPVSLSAIVSPAALAAGDTDNYDPTGLAAANVLRLTPDATNSALTGLVAQVNRLMLVCNVGTAGNLVLEHDDAGSTAGNRFILPGASALTLGPGSAVRLWYDAISERWRALAY